jgi:hypothetical protein
MRPRCARLVAVCLLLLGSAGRVAAGGIHIRYGPDAPERLAASNIRYYEGVLNLQHHHPLEFAREHPFYTKMFEDPVMLGRLLHRWEAHEQRFEYWHDCLWKVLDGYRHTHPELPGRLAAPGTPVNPGDISVAERNGGVPETGGGGGGGGEHMAAVPEPSSGLLIVLGMLIAGSGLAWSARRRP